MSSPHQGKGNPSTLLRQHQQQQQQQRSPVPSSTTRTSSGENLDEGKGDDLTLKRRLTLVNGVSVIFGLAVGGGVFITPQNVLMHANSVGLTLFMWSLGGLLSILGALSYAEIGVAYPVAGEKYAYLDILYGPFLAFTFMWQYLLIMRPGGNAIKALMCARYLLKPIFPECQVPDLAVKLVATSFVAIITFVNCRSVRGSLRGQSLMTGVTVASLSLLAVVGIVHVIAGWTGDALVDPFSDSRLEPSSLIHAFHSTVFSYYGWTALNFLVEELKNPNRNLPLSVVISLVLTTVLYVLVNLAYVAVLGKEGVIQSEAVAISVALKVFGTPGWLMSVMIAITAFSSYNSGLLVGSRLAYVGARKGHLPKIFSFISVTHLSPVASVILQSLLSLTFLWFVDVFGIINNLVFCALISDLLVVSGFIRARCKEMNYKSKADESEPEVIEFMGGGGRGGERGNGGVRSIDDSFKDGKEEKLKMPIAVHACYLLMVTFLIGVTLTFDPAAFASGLAVATILSSVYYVLVIRCQWKPFSAGKHCSAFNSFVQKLFLCAEGDKKDEVH